MDTPLILLLLLAFAFAITHLERRLLGPRAGTFADSEYLLLGLLSGPLVLGVLSEARLVEIEPLLGVIAGFLGFAIGVGLPVSQLADVPRRDVVLAVVATLGTVVTVAIVAWLGFELVPWQTVLGDEGTGRLPPGLSIVAAATLGLGSVAVSIQAVRRAIALAHAEGPVSRLLPRVAQAGRVLAVVGFEIATASERGLEDPRAVFGAGASSLGLPAEELLWSVLAWDAVAILAGVIAGLVFVIFVGKQDDGQRLFVATIGLVLLASGVAHALSLSPLGLGLIAGFVVANASPVATKVAAQVDRLRGPACVMLLTLAGAMWTPIPTVLWTIPIGYLLVRALALRVVGDVTSMAHPELGASERGLGFGLLGQSALPVAIALNFDVVHDTPLTDAVVTALLAGAVLNKLWAAYALRRLLRNVGETGRAALAASRDSRGRPVQTPSGSDLTHAAHQGPSL